MGGVLTSAVNVGEGIRRLREKRVTRSAGLPDDWRLSYLLSLPRREKLL